MSEHQLQLQVDALKLAVEELQGLMLLLANRLAELQSDKKC
jgi:hypothetical protein